MDALRNNGLTRGLRQLRAGVEQCIGAVCIGIPQGVRRAKSAKEQLRGLGAVIMFKEGGVR